MAAKGKSPILTIIILLAVAGIGYFLWKKKKDTSDKPAEKETAAKGVDSEPNKRQDSYMRLRARQEARSIKPTTSGFGSTLPNKKFGNISLISKPISGGLTKTMSNTKLGGTSMAGA